ncbi:hypothetical protein LEP1GSC038_2572 [Leptospira weilii str. 2006001855]|uniref:Uncharacterized protein n=2 Tax=Leptospira weilii TaxID=28184 RepID=M6Q4D2_9LEPT|nr:hypothetical protein LEP1GSC038_2572 [Leptospira weilii str. 2006001855]EMN88015.1 hypothetical protein LEP1GSC108_0794 [Leptospira weilii str. UI 13098]OMI17389.1 hypothetical protein BUQ74_10410 [Leptospira weilii serovar Heyan]
MRILLYYFSIISGHTIDSGFTSGEQNTILHTHSLDWSVFALFSGIQEFSGNQRSDKTFSKTGESIRKVILKPQDDRNRRFK